MVNTEVFEWVFNNRCMRPV